MKNALYVENGKLTGNHPLLVTNKWLTEVDLNNIDYIDVKNSNKIYSHLFLLLVVLKQITVNKLITPNVVYCFDNNNSEYLTYWFDSKITTYYLNDEVFNAKFWCNTDHEYGDHTNTLSANECIPNLYVEIINVPLNKDELLIKYLT